MEKVQVVKVVRDENKKPLRVTLESYPFMVSFVAEGRELFLVSKASMNRGKVDIPSPLLKEFRRIAAGILFDLKGGYLVETSSSEMRG